MSKFRPYLTGREARRAQQFPRRKGAGWTRSFRKGREQRLPYVKQTESLLPADSEETP